MKEDKILIDTNILVYAYDLSDKTKHELSSNLLKKCWENKKQFMVSLQNLSEFYVVVTKKIQNPIANNEAEKVVKQFIEFNNWIKLTPKKTTLLKAMEISKINNISYWDAMVVAVMIENNVKTIYTENLKDFRNLKGINAINPFTNEI